MIPTLKSSNANNIVKFIFIFIIFITLSGCDINVFSHFNNKSNNYSYNNIAVGIIGDNSTISRALVSKMLALANYDKNNILALDDITNFDDLEDSKWYDKYINAVYLIGDMSGISDNEFNPDGDLTIMQTQYLINKYDASKQIEISEENQNKPISYALWCEIYLELINNINNINSINNNINITIEEVVVLATPETSKGIQEDYAITDKGILCFEGLNVNQYINCEIKIIRNQEEVIAITEVVNTEPTLNSAVIINSGKNIDKNYIDVLIAGATKRLYYDGDLIAQDYLNNNLICNVKISTDSDSTNIEHIDIFYDTIRGTIKQVNNNIIKINNIEYILDEDFKVYSDYNNTGDFAYASKQDLIIGQDIANFYITPNENKIYGAIINSKPQLETIRVYITNNLYAHNNYYFNDLNFTANNNQSIQLSKVDAYDQISHLDLNQDEEYLLIKDGQDFDLTSSTKLLITAPDGIIINSDGYENRVFYGTLEIQKINNQYTLISEVTIESYISSIIAGNLSNLNTGIPTDNLEFLKTLAVLLRTNMVYHVYQNNFQEIGANIDDTCQLYNYANPLDLHQQASIQTMGEIISSNKLNYFTFFEYSNGMTANSGEIWGNEDYFYYPTENKEFLNSKRFVEELELLDISSNLTDEINANIFFKTKDVLSVEASSDWFRWSVTLNQDDLSNINQEIITISSNEEYKYYIKFLENNNNYNYYISNYKNDMINIQDIGVIKDIRVLERGAGGNITMLEISGELQSVRVQTDELIKNLFKPNQIINSNGDILYTANYSKQLEETEEIKKVEETEEIEETEETGKIKEVAEIQETEEIKEVDIINLNGLPSSCFVFDKVYDADLNLVELTIYGGGYGHGVGLSLYGASKLSDESYLYEEILEMYYNNIKISNLNNL